MNNDSQEITQEIKNKPETEKMQIAEEKKCTRTVFRLQIIVPPSPHK